VTSIVAERCDDQVTVTRKKADDWRGSLGLNAGYTQRVRRTSHLAFVFVMLLAAGALSGALSGAPPDGLTPGTRVLLDAHNSYPENGQWADRIDRAIGTGTPLAIEQDLGWFKDPATGAARSVVSHGAPFTGQEPSMREYFFERIRPIVEQALKDDRRETWPIVTLNLDFKTDEPEHHAAVLQLLRQYEAWLCTAPQGTSTADIQPLTLGPVLVLTGEQDAQEQDFSASVPAGGKLLLFGAVHKLPSGLPGPRTNYRRWWNNSWVTIEPEGQPKAGAWTAEDEARLTTAVRAAHQGGLWIRFYTLDGYDPADRSGGWSPGYNFGSLDAVRERWRAAIRAGVDFVAVNQYEEFVKELHRTPR